LSLKPKSRNYLVVGRQHPIWLAEQRYSAGSF
jgi:hypothetical protein